MLATVSCGAEIARLAIEEQFDVTARTVKRDLDDLLGLGLVEFVPLPLLCGGATAFFGHAIRSAHASRRYGGCSQ